MQTDARLSSPAALRNRGPILDVLRTALPDSGTVLEVASGSGEHILHFADALPALTWQPSDPSPAARASIAAWLDEERHDNVLAPLALDAAAPQWPVARADAVLAINMVHISPWRATLGLLDGAARLLPPGGTLFLYGPYRRAGIPLSESNEAFDADLKVRNPDWGLRDLDAVAAAADAAGLTLAPVVEMPANNLSVMFARR
jgi:SAM-dependent methyltransferase